MPRHGVAEMATVWLGVSQTMLCKDAAKGKKESLLEKRALPALMVSDDSDRMKRSKVE